MEFRTPTIPNAELRLTPPSPYGGSIYLRGYGEGNSGNWSYFSVDYDVGLSMSAFTEWTIEFWYKWHIDPRTSLPNTVTVMGAGNFQQGYDWAIKMGAVQWYMNVASPAFVGGTSVKNFNQGGNAGGGTTPDVWYHAAFVRANGTIRSWLNGVNDPRDDWTNAPTTSYDSARKFAVGRELMNNGSIVIGGGIGAPLTITNLKIQLNQATYSSQTFTPPEFPLTADGSTALLMNVTSAQTAFVDSSPVGRTITNGPGVYFAQYDKSSPFPFTI